MAQQQPKIEVSRRTLLQYSLGAAGLATLASACSASTSGGSGGGGEGALTFMATQFNPVEERQKYEAVLKQYAPGVNFNPVEQGVFATTIKSQVAAGKVQVNMVGGLHGDLAPFTEQLVDLSSLASELQSKGYAADLLELGKLGGTHHEVHPVDAGHVRAWRSTRRRCSGCRPGPTSDNLTYDQFLAWAERRQDGNGGKPVFGMPAGPKGLYHRFFQGFLLPSFTGGQMTTFRSADAVTAWKYMKELWAEHEPGVHELRLHAGAAGARRGARRLGPRRPAGRAPSATSRTTGLMVPAPVGPQGPGLHAGRRPAWPSRRALPTASKTIERHQGPVDR